MQIWERELGLLQHRNTPMSPQRSCTPIFPPRPDSQSVTTHSKPNTMHQVAVTTSHQEVLVSPINVKLLSCTNLWVFFFSHIILLCIRKLYHSSTPKGSQFFSGVIRHSSSHSSTWYPSPRTRYANSRTNVLLVYTSRTPVRRTYVLLRHYPACARVPARLRSQVWP